MSKLKKKYADTKKAKAITTITQSVKKKGKIKGKNKRETKTLRGMCPHHIINKKGNLKKRIITEVKELDGKNEGYCFCELCGEAWPMRFMEKNDVKEATASFMELVNQYKFASTEIGSSSKNVDYGAQLGAMLANFPKMYNRTANIVEKQDSVKKKKKNKGGDSANFGEWKIRR